MNPYTSIRNLFPYQFHKMISGLEKRMDQLQEIRLRVNAPVIFMINRQECYPDGQGHIHRGWENAIVLKQGDIEAIFNHICNYSPYAYEAQLKQGYLTVAGGHRVGIFGQAVMDGDKVTMLKQIQFLHIRIVHEIIGVADPIISYLFEKDKFVNTLIVSPPGVGKTTMLRDLARQISDGNEKRKGMQVCVIDERSEIAGCFMGVPQNRVGMRTDVLDACPKAVGMSMAIRAMGPQLLVVDELGLEEDYKALFYASGCGVSLLASAHGNAPVDVFAKSPWKRERFLEVFQRFLVLRWDKGQPKWKLYDEKGDLLAGA